MYNCPLFRTIKLYMPYSIISQSSSWIEGEAIEQLRHTANLPYMKNVVGMPDLHPGKGSAVGAAFLTQDNYIYPHLIGSDIGCGMQVAVLDMDSHKINQTKLAKKMERLESVDLGIEDESLGFVGGGNHFVELQKIVSTQNENIIPRNCTIATIHTGSRGLGAYILNEYASQNKAAPVEASTELGQWYLQEHSKAVVWAQHNRQALSNKLQICLSTQARTILDIYHNYLEPYHHSGEWIHRKGAASSNNELVVIPGSRGDHSYIVKPLKSNINLESLAHGAGRKWQRSSCKCKLENKYTAQQLRKTKLGSIVLCDDKELLYEEAPEAYKKISSVVSDLQAFNLIEVVAIVAPIVTYKTYSK